MKNRIEKLRRSFDSLGVDAIYLTSRTSHRYFTKFDKTTLHILYKMVKLLYYEYF